MILQILFSTVFVISAPPALTPAPEVAADLLGGGLPSYLPPAGTDSCEPGLQVDEKSPVFEMLNSNIFDTPKPRVPNPNPAIERALKSLENINFVRKAVPAAAPVAAPKPSSAAVRGGTGEPTAAQIAAYDKKSIPACDDEAHYYPAGKYPKRIIVGFDGLLTFVPAWDYFKGFTKVAEADPEIAADTEFHLYNEPPLFNHVSDSIRCILALLKKYPGVEVVLLGYSNGGISLKEAADELNDLKIPVQLAVNLESRQRGLIATDHGSFTFPPNVGSARYIQLGDKWDALHGHDMFASFPGQLKLYQFEMNGVGHLELPRQPMARKLLADFIKESAGWKIGKYKYPANAAKDYPVLEVQPTKIYRDGEQ